MCGRYTLATASPDAIRARFPVGESVEITPRFNVAPGDHVLGLTTDRAGEARGELLRWGLVPAWADDAATGLRMINARIETVAQRPAFRHAFERYRCLIIADGFYEWRALPGQRKQPFHITRRDGEVFAFAGLWSSWRCDGRDPLRTCTILTTAANAAVAPLHDRMPVILAPDAEAAWLDRDTPVAALSQSLRSLDAGETAVRAVDTAVNDAGYDGPECLAAPSAGEQTALF